MSCSALLCLPSEATIYDFILCTILFIFFSSSYYVDFKLFSVVRWLLDKRLNIWFSDRIPDYAMPLCFCFGDSPSCSFRIWLSCTLWRNCLGGAWWGFWKVESDLKFIDPSEFKGLISWLWEIVLISFIFSDSYLVRRGEFALLLFISYTPTTRRPPLRLMTYLSFCFLLCMSFGRLFIRRIGAFLSELSFDSSMSISLCDCFVPVPSSEGPLLSTHWIDDNTLSYELAKRIMNGFSMGQYLWLSWSGVMRSNTFDCREFDIVSSLLH